MKKSLFFLTFLVCQGSLFGQNMSKSQEKSATASPVLSNSNAKPFRESVSTNDSKVARTAKKSIATVARKRVEQPKNKKNED